MAMSGGLARPGHRRSDSAGQDFSESGSHFTGGKGIVEKLCCVAG